MNTPSNAVLEPALESQAIAPAGISECRRMYWSVRRELWENRSIYVAPLAVAALVLVGFLIATIGRALATGNMAERQAVLEEPYTFAMGVIMATAFIVGIFYSLDALHGERRDRSILFWKSLPVSDLTTVLSKASIPVLFLPLFSFAVVVATQSVMLLLSTLVLLGSGLSVDTLWTQVSLSQAVLLYHLLTVHVLWHAPIYGWLLLVSAWARRAAVLWAALPVLAIAIVERIAFNTSHFAAMVIYRFTGPEDGSMTEAVGSSTHSLTHINPGAFLSSPGLWIGLAVAAAFLLAAVRLRRNQGPS
jgi:ABC-2 type transport system permease protein